jgi:WD40 repeat protein
MTACWKAPTPMPAVAPGQAFLRIEAGMHTETIFRLDVDAAGRYLVTGSDDKTVRVWDLRSGQLQRVLRPPIGKYDGKIYAVAISPDGGTVAAGGLTEHNLYLFERQTGRMLRRISGLSSSIHHLAFSRDGALLVAAQAGPSGVQVFRAANGKELSRDLGYGGRSAGADFDPAGRLVTSSYDGQIRLYGKDLKILAAVEAPGGKQPLGIAFSPDGSRIAVGYFDSPHVDVLAGKDLQLLYSADTKKISGALGAVAWSTDGALLYAAGTYRRDHDLGSMVCRWAGAGRGAWTELRISTEAAGVTSLRPLADGSVAFASNAPAWGVLSYGERLSVDPSPVTAVMRELENGFRVSADGKTVRFGYELFGFRPALFNLAARKLILDPPADLKLKPARISAAGLAITGGDAAAPRLSLNGKLLPLEDDEEPRSWAVAPDFQSFVLGTSWNLRSFDRAGKRRWAWTTGGIWQVQVTGNGYLAIAALADGTIRWYRYSDGQELLALYPHTDGHRWVLWTPSGYYDASEGGESLLGWQVNHGFDHEGEFFPVAQFRDHYHRPEVIDSILDTLDEGEALRQAGITPQVFGAG